MSKKTKPNIIFKNKELFTLEQSAKYLAVISDQEVSEIDVLDLALQGKLQLSVRFPTGAYLRPCKHSNKEAARQAFPKSEFYIPTVEIGSYKKIYEPPGIFGYVEYEGPVFVAPPSSIYDLPVIEAGRYAIEARLDGATDRPINLIAAAFVEKEGQLFQLYKHNGTFHESPIFTNKLPDDFQFVVRRESLEAFVNSIEEKKSGTLTSRERTTLLNTIGGLVNLMLTTTQGGQKISIYESQEAIIDGLLTHFPNHSGIAKSTLELKFGEANRVFKETESNPN